GRYDSMNKNLFKTFTPPLIGLLLCIIPANFIGAQTTEKPDEKTKSFTIQKELWATPFKSQGETGTCWCFSTISFLESEAHRLGRGQFELSQMYIAYHAYLEKALRHVRSHGESAFREGGLSHDVLFLMKKYGAVPKSAYTGLQDDAQKHDHREMYAALSGLLSGVIKSGNRTPISGRWTDGRFSATWFDAFRGCLDAYLGMPPKTITFDNNNMTPKQFADDILNIPYDDYIEITSYSLWPFYSKDELLLPDNWLHHDEFYNVPLDDFIRIIDHALTHDFSLVADLHLKGAEFRDVNPYILGHDEASGKIIDQNERDTMLENWRTEDVHLEHFIGLGKDESDKKFYKAKDSMGSEHGEEGPYYSREYFSEGYVRSRVLFIMLHRDGLPDDIRIKLGI
ncbi:hypothetical protein JXO59_11960, partial [candidate division KSB1 bacterium]|nr:hypothetical protein [candidate division KSB1 bacterium]